MSSRKHSIGTFRKDESGSVAIIFGLLATVLFLSVGAAVDIGRWQHARTRTLAAIDAAVLAGGRSFQVNPDAAKALQVAANVYADNINTRSPVLSDNVAFVAVDNNTAFTATGNAWIQTPFLKMAKVDKLPLLNNAGTEFAKAVLPGGGSLNAKTHLEVSVMLDITGSMAGSKLTAMKTAAKDLVDIVVWADQSTYTSRIALVPFSSHVNVATYATAVRGASVSGTATPATYGSAVYDRYRITSGSSRLSLTTCVSERTGAEAYTDAPPTTARVGRAYGACAPSSSSTIIPLTNDKTALKNAIDSYSAAGSTAGHLGTAWAWYMISPKWAYLWPEANRPKSYEAADVKKVIILMTDGEYNTQYCRGVETDDAGCSGPNGSSDSQARKLCTEMRKQNVTLYSIGFQIDSSTAETTLKNFCASESDNYYKATTAKQLQEAFRDIALSISELRLSH